MSTRPMTPKKFTLSYYLCCKCDQPVKTTKDGCVVDGNIAAPTVYGTGYGGLIGNNFPQKTGSFSYDEVRKECWCWTCFDEVTYRNRECV